MLAMTKEEILHLGTLSKIRLSDDEANKMNGEIDAILEYVSAVNDIVDSGDLVKEVGAVHNVFRKDEVTNEPGSYTESVSAQFPDNKGAYLKVKKILNTDD